MSIPTDAENSLISIVCKGSIASSNQGLSFALNYDIILTYCITIPLKHFQTIDGIFNLNCVSVFKVDIGIYFTSHSHIVLIAFANVYFVITLTLIVYISEVGAVLLFATN